MPTPFCFCEKLPILHISKLIEYNHETQVEVSEKWDIEYIHIDHIANLWGVKVGLIYDYKGPG